MIRQYLLLIRLPNAFTAPSNILTGYFAVIIPSHTNISNLSILMLSSALLYISGIVFNDYFDIEIDRKERPLRPLVTGIITSKKAFIIALAAMVAANILAFTVDIISLIVTIILSATIIGYDYRLKQTMAGPLTMGSARFLNIFLGASPAFGGLFFFHDNFLILRLILVSMLMLLYVLSISFLSRREISITTHSRRIIAGPFTIIFAIISIIVVTLFFGIFQVDLVPNLVLFSAITIVTFKQTVFRDYSSKGIQKAITILVLSIIVLDSIFVSGTANIFYGLTTLLLIIPSVVLARKLYVT